MKDWERGTLIHVIIELLLRKTNNGRTLPPPVVWFTYLRVVSARLVLTLKRRGTNVLSPRQVQGTLYASKIINRISDGPWCRNYFIKSQLV